MNTRKNARTLGALSSRMARLKQAARDQGPVSGLTHQFYKYPARFSPQFARAAIESFSAPGDIVLDPFMGGGTSVVEAMALGRRSIGNDLNSLSVFVATVKSSVLNSKEQAAIKEWACDMVPRLRCNWSIVTRPGVTDQAPRNMTIPVARWLRKTIAQCLDGLEEQVSTPRAKRFARCVVLNVGQWALNGRRQIPTAEAFRKRIRVTAEEMLIGLNDLKRSMAASTHDTHAPVIREGDAANLHSDDRICRCGLVDMVVTSPPYPGVHMLYHRWQVDGRKESDVPYWISGTSDGAGASFYNFADRRRQAEDRYFAKATRAFSAVRHAMKDGGILAQLIAFSEPGRQLPRYLRMLERAGFIEERLSGERRIWRSVPNRSWHANSKGRIASSREVLLLHKAS